MAYYIAFALTGALYGITIGILLCQMDVKWKITCGLTSAGLIGAFYIVYNMFIMDNNIIAKINCFATFITFLIIGCIVIFIIMCRSLYKKNVNYKLSISDILLGRKKTIDEYYKSIQSDAKIKTQEFKKKEKEIKEKEQSLADTEKHIKNMKEEIASKISEGLFIDLPLDTKVPIDEEFLKRIPDFTENLLNYSKQLTISTNEFISEYENLENKSDQGDIEFVIAYLKMLCVCTSIYLFDSLKDIRTHIRILTKDNKYEKVVAALGDSNFNRTMTKIPGSRGMIYKAGQNKISMIKSLNIEHHSKGKNDNIWKDYLTLIFDKFYVASKPFLSMGISIKNTEMYGRQLQYLNYCKIEMIIQEELIKVNDVCDIMATLQEYKKEVI